MIEYVTNCSFKRWLDSGKGISTRKAVLRVHVGGLNEGYGILYTSEEGTEDGPRVLLFIYMGECTILQIYVQRIVIFFQFIGHGKN